MARWLRIPGFRRISDCKTRSVLTSPHHHPRSFHKFVSSIIRSPFYGHSSLWKCRFQQQSAINSWVQLACKRYISRECSTASSFPPLDVNKEVDLINRCFAEAREEIELALESKESVYFNEEAECARDAVEKVLRQYEELLAKLNEKDKGSVQRSMGLKMEQLKAEVARLVD